MHSERLERLALPHNPSHIVIDEIQRIPALLDEVHRLIEKRRWRFGWEAGLPAGRLDRQE